MVMCALVVDLRRRSYALLSHVVRKSICFLFRQIFRVFSSKSINTCRTFIAPSYLLWCPAPTIALQGPVKCMRIFVAEFRKQDSVITTRKKRKEAYSRVLRHIRRWHHHHQHQRTYALAHTYLIAIVVGICSFWLFTVYWQRLCVTH